MSLFDSILGQLTSNTDLASLAGKVGIDPSLLEKGLAALGQAHPEPGNTIESAAASSGIDAAMLTQLVQQFGGEEKLGQLSQMLKDVPGGASVLGMIDRDGDGNPIDDLADMAKGLFGSK